MEKIIDHVGGFHMIELMISISIMSILIALCYPSYSHYVIQARRLDAATQLSKLAIAMEHYHLSHHTYENATLAALHFPAVIANGNYQLIIETTDEHDYLLNAMPLRNQAKKDRTCASLTLNSMGEKGIRGMGRVDECW